MRKEFRSSVGKDLNGNTVYNSVERRQSLKGSSWKERRGVYDKKLRVYSEIEDSGGISYIGIFKLLLVILLMCVLFRVLSGYSSGTISFESFFDMLVSVPDIDITKMLGFVPVNLQFPFWLDWLEGFLNAFFSLVNVLLFIGSGLLQCVLYI